MQKKVIIRGSVQKFQFFGLHFYLSGAKLGEKNWYWKILVGGKNWYILKNICGTVVQMLILSHVK